MSTIIRIYESGPQGPKGQDGGSYIPPAGIISSSNQIASDISGSFLSASNSLSERINVFENKTIVSSSQQIDFNNVQNTFLTSSFIRTDFTGSFNSFSASIESKVQRLESATSSYVNNSYTSSNDVRVQRLENFTSSYAIKNEVSGAFASDSSSLAIRISNIESKSIISSSNQVVYSQISGIPSGLLSSSNGFVSSSQQIDYTLIQNKPISIQSASFAQTASYFALPSNILSSSAQIASSISGSFTKDSGSFQQRIFDLESKTIVSSSNQVVYYQISGVPIGILSSSNGFISASQQVDYTLLSNKPSNLFSASQQVNYNQISNIPSGIISSSADFVLNQATSSFVLVSQTGSMLQIYALKSEVSGAFSFNTSSFLQSNLTSSFLTTSSFNSFTSSLYSRIVNVESYTSSYALKTEISGALSNGGSSYIQTIGMQIITYDTYITSGFKGYKHIGFDSNIKTIGSIANTTGSISINILKNNNIIGTYSLNNQTGSIDSILTNWTSSLNKNDLIQFYVSQSSTYITNINLFIDIESR